MRHSLDSAAIEQELGAGAAGAAEAIERCVHCGFCLATCPTYAEVAEEAESPRGRIVLMKEVLEGGLSLEDALPHVDSCLGCLACETSCPSGVEYGSLLRPFREMAETRRSSWKSDARSPWIRRWLLPVMESPRRFLWALRLGRLAGPLRMLAPEALRPALDLMPTEWPRSAGRLAGRHEPDGPVRARVALLPGCVQQVVELDIHRATVEVLLRNGVEVVVPEGVGCCGALAAHAGSMARARRLARRNLGVLQVDDVDAVLTNAAGCGSAMQELDAWFDEGEERVEAKRLADKSLDVATFLDQLGIRQPAEQPEPLAVVVQHACHLLHGQGVRDAPGRLLERIPGLRLLETPEADICCGSAGIYNLEHPTMARRLGHRKARKLIGTGAQVVVSSNIGCMVQIRQHLAERQDKPADETLDPTAAYERLDMSDPDFATIPDLGSEVTAASRAASRTSGGPVRVRHLMQVLRDAYEGERV